MNNVCALTVAKLFDGKLYIEGNSKISIYLLKYTRISFRIDFDVAYIFSNVAINSNIQNKNSSSQKPKSNWLNVHSI